MGVSAECAAEQIIGRIQERKTRGWVSADYGGVSAYAGDFSWANCETKAHRLIPYELDTFVERCEAVIDNAVRPEQTDATAEKHGLSRAEYLAEIKAMHCEGSRDHLRNYPQFHGDWVAGWLPLEGSVCWESALLNAARTAAYGKGTRVKFC